MLFGLERFTSKFGNPNAAKIVYAEDEKEEEEEHEDEKEEDEKEEEHEEEDEDDDDRRRSNTTTNTQEEQQEVVTENVIEYIEVPNEKVVEEEIPIIKKVYKWVVDLGFDRDTDGDKLVDALDPHPDMPGQDDIHFIEDSDKNQNGVIDSFE